MRQKLLNYSLETDQLVFLQFSDGKNLRVGFDEVDDHLAGPDLAKVKRAIKIRQNFFKHNLPGTMVVLAAVGLGVFVAVDYDRVSGIINGTRPVATPAVEQAAPASAIPTSAPTATPAAVTRSAAPAAGASHAPDQAAVPARPAQPASKTQSAVPAVPATPAAPALQAPGVLESVTKSLERTSSQLLPKL